MFHRHILVSVCKVSTITTIHKLKQPQFIKNKLPVVSEQQFQLSIDLFPIIFDVRGLGPDMLHFPCFFSDNLCIYSVMSQCKHKLLGENSGKTLHVWSKAP